MKKKDKNPFAGLRALPFDLPQFASEAEEAGWWQTHKAEAEQLFDRAHAAGASLRLRGGALAPTLQTTIRLMASDVARARTLAQRKGLRYQTYLKMLIHEALEREGKAS